MIQNQETIKWTEKILLKGGKNMPAIQTYKQKILKEIDLVPHEKIPKLYKFVHLLAVELMPKTEKTETRGSLKNIWKGSQIDESLFIEAKKNLFSYEYK